MSVIIILVIASLSIAVIFLAAFVWSIRHGQFDDETGDSMRLLLDDQPQNSNQNIDNPDNTKHATRKILL